MSRLTARLVLAGTLAACGGEKTTAPPPPPTATVSIAPAEPSMALAVGASVTLSATPHDAAGNAVSGRPVAWTTSRSEVATVGATTGLVTGVGEGLTVIRATIDHKTDEVLVTVTAPVTGVDVTARRSIVGVRGVLQLTATTRGPNGVTLSGRSVAWSSSDETKARVSPTGLVSGAGAGSVTITATSEGVPGTIRLDVVDLPAPQITAVSPATLGPGVTATITGSSFETNPADLEVTVGGVPVTVTSATQSELTVQIPAFLPCRPTQDAAVTVTGIGGTATRAHPLKIAQQRSVAVGEVLVLGGVDLRCNELPPTPARYAIAVINGSRVPSNAVGFELRGAAGPAAASVASTAPVALTWASAAGGAASLVSPVRRTTAALDHRDHLRRLDQERELRRQLGSPRRALAAARVRAGAPVARSAQPAPSAQVMGSAAPVPLEVGATTTLKIRTSNANCSASRDVPARVVYVGSTSVILESTDAPLAKTMDADYVALGTEYDEKMHPVLAQYFGNPLAFDDSTDNNDRIVMLFTKAVNDRAANLLGFVTICDFFPATNPATAASNLAEIFYARVPTTADGAVSDINTRPGWMHIMRGTLIHEAKHLVGYAERANAPELAELEESWLEEATAQAAIELWGRATYYGAHAAWKGNATYERTMYCDVHATTDAACSGHPSIISDHFLFLFGYYENIETKAYFSPAGSDNNVYGSGWLFTRWAADNFATDEAAFFKALTQSWTLTGLRNIEARIGRSFDSFHPSFMMSLFADDLPGFTPSPGALYTIPSWNTRDMFLGMSRDFRRGGQPIPAFPLRVHATPYGAFAADVGTLLGGSASYVDLSGAPSGPQVLELRAPGGLTLSPDSPLRLAILRVQ